jgi:hypothetical protein
VKNNRFHYKILSIDNEVVFSLNEGFVKKAVVGVRSAPNSTQ